MAFTEPVLKSQPTISESGGTQRKGCNMIHPIAEEATQLTYGLEPAWLQYYKSLSDR